MPRATLEHMRSIHALIASTALVVVLAGCTPTAPEPSPSPTASATGVKPTPKPTPSITIPPLAIPDCETILPLATAKELFSENTEYLGEQPASEFAGRQTVASIPVVLSTASPTRACVWGIPQSDGYFELVIAGITAAEVATLQGELTAAGYSQTTMGTVTAFELEGENEVGSVGTTHLFTGEVWIVCDGSSLHLSGAVAGAALDALRTANPSLGL
ncbi:MAG: hypothetical protein JWR04_2885 [Rhodoglobus sp.]|nr:hypothetical protein [Rhodoglobus sp.]